MTRENETLLLKKEIERLKSEIKLLKERTDYSNILEMLPFPAFMKNKYKEYTGCNKAFCELLGIPSANLIGKTANDIFSSNMAKRYEDLDDEIFNSGKDKIIKEDVITIKKSRLILYKKSINNSEKESIGVVGMILDPGQIIKVNNVFTEQQRFLDSIITNLPLLIFTLDEDGTISFALGKVLELLHVNPQSFIGMNYTDVFADYEEVRRTLAKALNGEIDFSFDALEEHYFESHFVKIEHGNMQKRLLGVSMDVTDRRRAELEVEKYLLEQEESKEKLEEYSSELEESQKNLIDLNSRKDRFFSIISHDLRSPFTSLIGLSDFIVQEFDTISKEELKESIHSFNRNTKNIMAFLDNLLNWARIQMNRQEIQLSIVNLQSVILNVIEIFKLNIKNKELLVNTDVMEELNLYADENMIQTAIRNIVSNSIKFTPDGGQINFSAVCVGDVCDLTISDSGIGIEDDILENLFKMDSIKSSPGLKGEKGSGLGLLLTKDLIEINGGSILVTTKKNEGTSFLIKLPLMKTTL